MDYLIIGILFFVGNAIWSIAFLFYQSYAKKKGENIALKEDSKEIAMLTELGKNMATKSDIREITLIAERTKNEATRESAQRISYETEKGKNLATKEDIEEIFDKNMIIDVDNNIPLIDLLIQMQIASSKREAKEFITGNSISINGEKTTDLEYNIDDNNFIDNTYIIIKKGKKNYYIGRKK